MDEIRFRREVYAGDAARVGEMVRETGFFTEEEAKIAVELVEENLARGESASGYFFVFAEDRAGRVPGYACFGPVPGSDWSFDLYWIVVEKGSWKRGLGRAILAEAEARVLELGGRRLYAETSSTPRYAPTRAFYAAAGYAAEALLADFYRAGDGKVFFVKAL